MHTVPPFAQCYILHFACHVVDDEENGNESEENEVQMIPSYKQSKLTRDGPKSLRELAKSEF